MQSIQKLGGISALVAAGTFLVGLVMFATVFMDYVSATDTAEAIAFIAGHQLSLHVWNITIMIVFGIVLVPVVLAIADRLRDAHSPLARVSAIFGFIWAGVVIAAGMITNIAYSSIATLQASDPEMAVTVWNGLEVVTNGLGGGNEVLGGVWVLGTSIVALRERLFARWTNYLGVVMGVAGLVTVVPALEDVGAIFGLGLIVWFVVVVALCSVTPRTPPTQLSPRPPTADRRKRSSRTTP